MTRSIALLALAACTSADIGSPIQSPPPTTPIPQTMNLQVGTPFRGRPVSFDITGGVPGDVVYLVQGDNIAPGYCAASIGGCLAIDGVNLLGNGPLDANGEASTQLTVPAVVPPGTQAAFQVVHPDPQNAYATQPVEVEVRADVDLQVAFANVPPTVVIGDDVSDALNASIRNAGIDDLEAPGARVSWHLEPSGFAAAEIASIPLPELDAGAVVSIAGAASSAVIPSWAPAGPGELWLVLDPDDDVEEYDEGNLTRLPVNVEAPEYDIVAAAPVAAAGVSDVQTYIPYAFKIDGNTTNTGAYRVHVYQSDDPVLDAGDFKVSDFVPLPVEENGAWVERTFPVRPLAYGAHRELYYIVVFDADGDVSETNESNNTMVIPYDLYTSAEPDLALTDLVLNPISAPFYSPISVTFTVHNHGMAPVDRPSAGLAVGPTEVYDDGEHFYNEIPGIVPQVIQGGESVEVTINTSLNEHVPAGWLWLVAHADFSGSRPQTITDNDTDATRISVGQPDLDLAILSMDVPNVAYENHPTRLGFSYQNLGTQISSFQRATAVYSPFCTAGAANNVPLPTCTRTSFSLAPSVTNTACAFDVPATPGGPPSGPCVIVTADTQGMVNDMNSSNDVLFQAIAVVPEPGVVHQGDMVVPSGSSLDLETGNLGFNRNADIRWDALTPTTRELSSLGGVTLDTKPSEAYIPWCHEFAQMTGDPIQSDDNVPNLLNGGDYLCAKTSLGYVATLRVVDLPPGSARGYDDLHLQWTVWDVPF